MISSNHSPSAYSPLEEIQDLYETYMRVAPSLPPSAQHDLQQRIIQQMKYIVAEISARPRESSEANEKTP